MIRIGIIGAENSHSYSMAKTINVKKSVPGVQVVAIWGETDAYAKKAAEIGQIPTIVKKSTDMLGKIDALVVDHRHARFHLPAALPYLEAKVPMFIDKPFCYRLAEGKAFLAKARKLHVPVTSFSSMPAQKAFTQFVAKATKTGEPRAVTSMGPADIKSQWGGIFFYGIHQVDMLIEAYGQDIVAVQVAKHKAGEKIAATATLFWANGLTAAMHCLIAGEAGFQLCVTTDAGPVSAKIASDADPYLTGIKRFAKMFKDRQEPFTHSRILAPVAVLEAMEQSVTSGKIEKVAKV